MTDCRLQIFSSFPEVLMSQQLPPSSPLTPREERRQQRRQRRLAWRRRSGWIGGAVLILLGVIFLLQNVTTLEVYNWWALFLLIPTVVLWGQAYERYRQDVELRHIAGLILGGLVTLLLALSALLGLDMGLIWPLLIIAVGLVLLASFFIGPQAGGR